MIFGNIQSVKTDKTVQEINISIVYFKVVNSEFLFMEESSVNNCKYLQIMWIPCTKELNVSIVLIVTNTFSKICSDQVRIMSFWVGESSKFSFSDFLEISINFVFDNIGHFMPCQINIKENVCERLLWIVDVKPYTINDSDSMVKEQCSIETLNILVSCYNHCCVEMR